MGESWSLLAPVCLKTHVLYTTTHLPNRSSGDARLRRLGQRVARPQDRHHAHVALVHIYAGERRSRRGGDKLSGGLEARDAL